MSADRSDISTQVVGRRALIAGGAGLIAGATALVAGAGAAEAHGDTSVGQPVPADIYAAICQLKANYVTATDSLPFPDSGDRALELYRATYAEDAAISAGYDPAAPNFLVHGPDELFQVLQAGLAAYRSSQHNTGVIHVSLSKLGHKRHLATITAHVLVTLVPIDGPGLTRLTATYHDEAQRRGGGRWQVTKSFAQYLATEVVETRALP